MFKGDCLSLNINNSNAFLSRYVMLCHAFRQSILSSSLSHETRDSETKNKLSLFSRDALLTTA